MRQAAIWVPGEGDGSFTSNDPNDRVVFYALGPEGYEIELMQAAQPASRSN